MIDQTNFYMVWSLLFMVVSDFLVPTVLLTVCNRIWLIIFNLFSFHGFNHSVPVWTDDAHWYEFRSFRTDAYNKIIKPKFQFDWDKLINQYQGREYIEKMLISDFQDADNLSIKNESVKKIFQGFNDYSFRKREFGIGIFITKHTFLKTPFKKISDSLHNLFAISSRLYL